MHNQLITPADAPEPHNFEVLGDGRTVWVNSPVGICVGRFTKMGVDVHVDFEKQVQGEHCLDCFKHQGDFVTSWQRFVSSMNRHYGVSIPENLKPSYVG